MTKHGKKVLFVSSELFPLAKTGGLADFSYNLPTTLSTQNMDVVVLIPAYQTAMEKLPEVKQICRVEDANFLFSATLLEASTPGTSVKLWLVDIPELYQRAGSPYGDEQGNDWPDNHQRFGHFCRVAAKIALGDLALNWQPDIVHCNDWQTGLVPALLSQQEQRPPC